MANPDSYFDPVQFRYFSMVDYRACVAYQYVLTSWGL